MFEQIIKRWLSESPQIFQIITTASVVITIILGIPALIETFQAELCELSDVTCFDMPEWWSSFWAKALPLITSASAFISKITATSEEKAKKGITDKL